MKIAVTGGCGFIGSNFVKILASEKASKHEIIIADKLSYAADLSYIKPLLKSKQTTFKQVDISDSKQTTVFLKKTRPDVIVHFAAETHVDNSIKTPTPFIYTNVVGTFNLLEAASIFKVKKFIHISTDEVYGFIKPNEDREFKETDILEPSSVYSSTKAASDLIALSYYKTYGLNTVVTRCCNNFGPNQHKEKFIPTIIKSILNKRPIPVYGNGTNVREWIYVKDHCKHVLNVLENGIPGEIYNIGSNTSFTNIELVKQIGDYMAKKYNLQYHIKYVTDRKGHDFKYAIDNTKLSKVSKYKPLTSFTSNLQSTIDWYYDILKKTS